MLILSLSARFSFPSILLINNSSIGTYRQRSTLTLEHAPQNAKLITSHADGMVMRERRRGRRRRRGGGGARVPCPRRVGTHQMSEVRHTGSNRRISGAETRQERVSWRQRIKHGNVSPRPGAGFRLNSDSSSGALTLICSWGALDYPPDSMNRSHRYRV